MYVSPNFKTKKQLKEAVGTCRYCGKHVAWVNGKLVSPDFSGDCDGRDGHQIKTVEVYQPNSDITGFNGTRNGQVSVEGPHYPEPHRWYARVEVVDGLVKRVIS